MGISEADTGIKNLSFSDKLRNLFHTGDQEKKDVKLTDDEKLSVLKNLLDTSFELMKKGEYEEAVKHLRSPQVAESVGLKFGKDNLAISIKRTPDEKEIDEIADMVAYHSHFNYTKPKPELKIAEIYKVPQRISGVPEAKIPKALWHEVALVAAEEWIHGMQAIRGSLTGSGDREKDVVYFFQKNGVEVTKNFLGRHNRDSV